MGLDKKNQVHAQHTRTVMRYKRELANVNQLQEIQKKTASDIANNVKEFWSKMAIWPKCGHSYKYRLYYIAMNADMTINYTA